jgi:uncharacterized membrane protein YobD (UPF0266 family)
LITEIVLIIGTILVLIWDVYLYLDKIKDNTISQVVIKRSKEQPVIPLLIGALIGHWFL